MMILRRDLSLTQTIDEWLYEHSTYNRRRNVVIDGASIRDKYNLNFNLFVAFLETKCFPNHCFKIKQISAGGCSYYPAIEITISEFNQLENFTVGDFLGYCDRQLQKIRIAKQPSYDEDFLSDMDKEDLLAERNSEKYRIWRNQVLMRDGVCQCCGYDKHLHVHHIFGFKHYPELRYNEDNGITLCKWCHEKYHSVYGKKNPNPSTFGRYMARYGVK